MRGRQTDGRGRATGGAERKSEVSVGLSSNLGDVSSVEGALVEPLLGDHETLRPRLPTDKGLSTRYIATGDRDDRGSGLAFLWGDSLSERAAMHMGDARGDPSDVDPRGDVPIDVRDAQGDSTAADTKSDTVGTDARDVLGERSITEVCHRGLRRSRRLSCHGRARLGPPPRKVVTNQLGPATPPPADRATSPPSAPQKRCRS